MIARLPGQPSVEAYGYAFIEDDRPGALRRGGRRAKLGVHRRPGLRAAAAGRDRRRRHARAGRGGDSAGTRIVYTGDTAPSSPSRSRADGADVLVHEATFTSEDARSRA